jgi:hypothetical protein
MLASLRTRQTALMLLMNIVYYLNFSALFFLSKSLFAARGLGGVGVFFSIQTMVMLAIRVLGSRLFDEIRKPLLSCGANGLTALGFGMLWATRSEGMALATGLVLGLAWGWGRPVHERADVRAFRARVQAVNSNLMVMALRAGNFLGPDSAARGRGAAWRRRFLAVGGLSCLGGLWLALLFLRRGWTGEAAREGMGCGRRAGMKKARRKRRASRKAGTATVLKNRGVKRGAADSAPATPDDSWAGATDPGGPSFLPPGW